MTRTYEEKFRDAKAAAVAAVERGKQLRLEEARRTAEFEELAKRQRFVIIPSFWADDWWGIYDTTLQSELGDPAKIDERWVVVCECYDIGYADFIADALNAAHPLTLET